MQSVIDDICKKKSMFLCNYLSREGREMSRRRFMTCKKEELKLPNYKDIEIQITKATGKHGYIIQGITRG